MIPEAEILQQKLSGLLSWEKRKRWEQILVALFCYSFLGALLILPLYPAGVSPIYRWFVPALFFVMLAPVWFLGKRWRVADSTRALAELDKKLCLNERSITAWEILQRHETRAAALLVLKEAGESLKTLDPRALFQRSWSWHGYLALPLALIWFGLLWFDAGLFRNRNLGVAIPQTLAYRLREFSRALQEKAKSEGLHESLQAGRELEKLAQKNIDTKASEERFKSELAGLTKKLEAAGKSAEQQQSFTAAESQQSLRDLRIELETARDLLNFSDSGKETSELGKQWLERLAKMPQLKRQFDRDPQARRGPGGQELRSFLNSLEKQVVDELDRRTVVDAQQFLQQLMQRGRGEKGQQDMQVAGAGDEDFPDEAMRGDSLNNLPGKEPGKKEEQIKRLPEFQAGAATRLKGILGEGQTNAMVLKVKPAPGKSEISQTEVIATYRRQAEAELDNERVPDALKDMIRNYFLSLGDRGTKEQKSAEQATKKLK